MPTTQQVRVVTRKSPLAMRQTEMTVMALRDHYPDWDIVIIPVSTTGDEQLQWSLEKSGGKGLFTSALEELIIAGEADLAVHSAKDLPTAMPDGLALAGFLPRALAHDRLVKRKGIEPVTIATASPRRRAQLTARFPNAQWMEIRGNVGTRLNKIATGYADATIMAAAGLSRLGITGWDGLEFEDLPVDLCVPAAGQGAIGLQTRAGECERFLPITCAATAAAVDLERALLAGLGGGCHSAKAVHVYDQRIHFFDETIGYRSIEFSDLPDSTDRANIDAIVQQFQSSRPS